GSPESAEHGRMGLESVTSRAATWMSKLGDLFQQRRVEVHTTWSPAHRAENPWLEQRPFVAPPLQAEREVPREGARSTPPSTGSATVPYELVQAEVSKQLEGAMSEIYGTMVGKLEYERKKAEEAELQAQALREQLEVLEMQTRELARGSQPREEGLGNDSALRAPFKDIYEFAYEQVQFYAYDQGVDPSRPPAADAGRGRRFLQGLLGFGTGGGATRTSGPTPTSTGAPPGNPRQPPAVASTNIAGSDQVLTAMAKGIESLLLNQGSRADRPETVKPGITELPHLPPYTPETGSIDLINWVTHITPIMEDLSDSSSVWWTATLQEVMTCSIFCGYALGKDSAFAYEISYLQEKALVLANLEKPSECSDAKGAVEALRKWALWRRRAMAIGITEPVHSSSGHVSYTCPSACIDLYANGDFTEATTWAVQILYVRKGVQANVPSVVLYVEAQGINRRSARPREEVAMKVLSVLEDVKRVRAFAPLVEAVDRWSKRWAPSGRTALMDSGATHPLRQPRNEQEWLDAMNVKVALAGDAKTTMKQTTSGTLLSGDELSQVI
ncbi:unnamed protein product, partial [Symbiodinium necroappetens]